MTTLIKIKLFFKKAWALVKSYWYLPLLLSWVVIVWLLLGRNSQSITEVLYSAEKNYRDQVRVLEKAHKEELEKRDKALNRYVKTVDSLEKELKRRRLDLTEAEKKRILQLVREFKNRPDEYTRKIAEEFGFEYVE